jgi:RNA recognition motif-containing protein
MAPWPTVFFLLIFLFFFMNIYVGNLSHSVNENHLRELFERFGAVSSAVIIKDKITRQPRGFGFVEMADDAQANAAIADLNGKEWEGRVLKINEARPREEGGAPRSGGFRQGGGQGGGFRGPRNFDGPRRDFRR